MLFAKRESPSKKRIDLTEDDDDSNVNPIPKMVLRNIIRNIFMK